MNDTCKSHVPHPCLVSRNGLDWVGEGLKERQTDGHTEMWKQVAWDLCWRNHNTQEARRIYYMELNRKVGLLHPAQQAALIIMHR